MTALSDYFGRRACYVKYGLRGVERVEGIADLGAAMRGEGAVGAGGGLVGGGLDAQALRRGGVKRPGLPRGHDPRGPRGRAAAGAVARQGGAGGGDAAGRPGCPASASASKAAGIEPSDVPRPAATRSSKRDSSAAGSPHRRVNTVSISSMSEVSSVRQRSVALTVSGPRVSQPRPAR